MLNDFEDKIPEQENENSVLSETDDTEEISEENGLEQELEQIRDMFQKSLDGEDIEQETDDGEQESEENSDADAPEYEFTDTPVCEICCERPKDLSKGEDFPYCEECARKLSRKPLGAKGIIVIIVAVIIAVASAYVTIIKYNPEADIYAVEAQSYADAGKLDSALNSYIQYFSAYQGKLEWAGKKCAMRAAKLYAACGYYSDAHDLISGVFTEEDLASAAYRSMADIENEYLVLNATYSKIYELISEPLSVSDPSKIDTKELCALLDGLKEEKITSEDAANGESYSELFIEYYKYSILASAGASLEQQYEQIKKVYDMDSTKIWLYGDAMGSIAARMGNIEGAEKLFNSRVELNAEDATAYACYANAYRFCEKPDADKMIEIINSGLNDSNKAESYRMLAIAYIMKGDYEKAYEYTTELYNTGSYSLQGIYTHAVCALLTDDTETYDTLEQMLAYYGYSMGENIVKLKNGKIKIDKLIYDTEGELA